jgi:hypothetical protein
MKLTGKTTEDKNIMKNYYIAINYYRSETSCGFANTWQVYTCSRFAQETFKNKIGYRLATRQEIRKAKKHPMPKLEFYDGKWQTGY